MKIKKILNQNAIVVLDEGQEKVAFGKGIGFNKKKNTLIGSQEIEHFFIMEPESQQKLQTLLGQIDEKFFFAGEHIIEHAETVLMEPLNEHLIITLADHIAFAAENISKGILIRNKLLPEIEVLYNQEFIIAQWAVEYLNKELDIPYTYDEAGYIAIHIHGARKNRGLHLSDNKNKSIREVTIISKIITLIEAELAIDIHSEKLGLSYSRLVNHLRLLLQRFQENKYVVLDAEILDLVKEKYSESYEIAKKIRVLLMKTYQLSITREELGYIAIHIERLR